MLPATNSWISACCRTQSATPRRARRRMRSWRRQCRRLSGLLASSGGAGPAAPLPLALEAHAAQAASPSSQLNDVDFSPHPNAPKANSSKANTTPGNSPAPSPKTSDTALKIATAGMSLWRAQTGAVGQLINELLGSTENLLKGPCSAGVTLRHHLMAFVVDQWLCAEGMAPPSKATATLPKMSPGFEKLDLSSRGRLRALVKESKSSAGEMDPGPTVCYLKGNVKLYGYRPRDHPPEPPVFEDFKSLPLREFSSVALPIQAGAGELLAVLQITSNGAQGNSDSARRGALQLNEAQLTGVQLLCSMAAVIFEGRRRIAASLSLRERASECVSKIAPEVTNSSNLTFFEQYVRVCCVKFFKAASVRLTWYDAIRRELIATDNRPRRGDISPGMSDGRERAVGKRNITRSSVYDSVAWKCIRMRKVLRLMPTKVGQAGLLIGPLIAMLANGASHIIGVLQIIGHKRTTTSTCFTDEDEFFFSMLIKVIGPEALRTMRAQLATGGDVSVPRLSLERMLQFG
mmetsp:Transcript_5376/g.13406  ORF Transcript_5376/g.13406 Transcript_5376/m.13406 type:complete len:518 (-) Transcript_5376:173-1726(-)